MLGWRCPGDGARCAVGSTVHSSTRDRSRLSLETAVQLCKQEIPTPSRGGAALYRSDKNEEAKVGRSSDDAQRALLRHCRKANHSVPPDIKYTRRGSSKGPKTPQKKQQAAGTAEEGSGWEPLTVCF